MRLAAALVAGLLLSAVAAVAAPPEENYVLHCSGCHRLDGAGTPGVVPSLHGLGRLLETRAGREYLARVPGVAQAPLSDAGLAALLNWVLLEFSGAPPVAPYTADEVAALRREPLRDPGGARAGLGMGSR